MINLTTLKFIYSVHEKKKKNIKRVKIPATVWEKMFIIHISNKALDSE